MYLYVKMMKFYKAETNGNDFVIIEGESNDLPEKQKKLIPDRKFGIGCDQLIFVKREGSRCWVEFFNQDGSHANMCGNGSCAVALLINKKYGVNNVELEVVNNGVENTNCLTRHNASKYSASVFFRQFVKYFSCQGLRFLSFAKKTLEQANSGACLDRFIGRDVVKSKGYNIAPPENIYTIWINKNEVTIAFPLPEQCDNIIVTGNKHLVLNMSEIDKVDEISKLNSDCNIHFIEILSKNVIRVKTFERGVGWTLACGSGAVAVGYHSKLRGKIEIIQDAGKSIVEVKETHVELTTVPKIVYAGEFYE